MKLPLPCDTQSALENNVLKATSNLGLLFNKYVSIWSEDWTTEVKRNKEKINLKAEFLEKIKQESSYLAKTKTSVESLYKRQQVMINDFNDSGWHVESFTAITDSRLIMGLGGMSVIETGMTLHPLYGFPYLPGSGLKGLARAYAEIATEHAPTEDEFRKELKEVFGSKDKDPRFAANNKQGKVFFMDGMPVNFPKLELDIMNPHYSYYYQGKKDSNSKGNPIPPADYLNPVPVTFLAIASDQPFLFTVFSRDKGLAEKARQWLIGGLTELGAGGKTNVGNGYFKIANSMATDEGSKTPSTKGKETTSETIIWENAHLKWSPGDNILKAEKDGQKAELKIADRSIVPPNLHKKLFDKKEMIKANVTVEQVGNYFKIVKIL